VFTNINNRSSLIKAVEAIFAATVTQKDFFQNSRATHMAAKWVDLLRMRLGGSPSVEQAITRPDISFLKTPAGPMRIRDSGGQSPSVIFACDGPNVLEHYDAVFELLSPSYRLICLEMPGFGFSWPNSSFDFSLRQYVSVVAHSILKLRAGPAVLMFPCAWSYVAFQLATEQPSLVDRLVVSQCPHWNEEQAWLRRIGIHGLIETPVIGQLFLAVASQRVSDMWYSNALPPGKPTNSFAEPARKVLSSGGIFCLASMTQTWFHIKNPSFKVTQPTMVMWGGSDRTHRRSNPDSVLDYLQSGKIMVFPEAGHFPELEDPERLKSLLANVDLWNGLRLNQPGRPAEAGLSVGEDAKHDESSTISASDHAEGQGQLVGRRKPFDSHL
jgi:pimeloyl-ACP methyl ester carboxylesterase